MDLINFLVKNSEKFDFCFTVSKNEGERGLIHANQNFCTSTGYTLNEITGRNCRFLQGPKTNKDHIRNISDALNKREPTFQEIINYTKSGQEFVNRLILLPLGDYILGFQNKLPNKEKLISLHDLEIGKSDINHYINNPLTIVANSMHIKNNRFTKAQRSIERIRNFIMAIEHSTIYPKIY